MKTPPEGMLSPKDVSYISDILSEIVVLYKRIDEESQTVEDSDVKSIFDQAKTLLTQQFTTLLGFLE